MTTTNYQQQATDFLSSNGITFSAKFVKHGLHFQDDKQTRDIYLLTLRRGKRSISFRFGQSIASQGKTPTAYDLLSCITKNDPGSFENFCGDFGYDRDSRKAEKVYRDVVAEWQKVEGFFTSSEFEELYEIQ
jgi:hypothetical protein